MRRHSRRRPAALLVLLALMAGLVTSSTTSMNVQATSIVPFAPRFSTNDNGSIAVFGNNLMVCPPTAADCAGARAGTNNRNNNNFRMVHLDVDGDATTFSSSSAQVALPDDAEVRWAGLYWGARLGAGAGGVAATGDGRQMKLRAPGDAGYRTVTAGRLFGPSTTPDRAYQSFADVTAIVQAAGVGTYFGADVPAATGEDRHAGWSLVVVYRSPSLPLRNLTVFDGLADVGQGDPQIITITGFRTPVTGTVNARIGLVAYEGDRGSSGDRAILKSASNPNGTLLSTALSQGTNFFNGANDDNGTLVTARSPADLNMLGFDIKNFDGPGILGNNESSAQIDLASTSERYFPGVVTTAIDVFAPDFSPSTKTVTNLTGGTPARVGDRLRYTVTFVNGGQDPAINASIIDPIPVGTSYVPGSLVVPAGTTGSFNSALNRVEVSPGDFPVGRSVEFTFDVDVGAAAANTEVANQATITYDGATVPELQDLQFSTRAASIPVVPSADLFVTKVNTPDPVLAGNILTSTITVRNGGPSPADDVVMSDALPPGVSNVVATSTQGTCVTTPTATAVDCTIGTIAPGAIVTITVRAAVPPDSTAASLTDVARVTSSTADPDPDDNTSAATSDVSRNADLSVTKTASPATVTPGGSITYTITATNNGPSTATAVAIDDTLPDPAVELLSASSVPAGSCVADANSARCTIPSLAPGASAVMTVSAVAIPSATAGIVENVASVSSATPDDDPSDNSITANVTIGPAVSDLDVVKAADAPTPLIAGVGEVRYTIEVANNGPSDADPVTVSDVLPPGFVVVSATTDRGTCTVTPAPTGDTVTCAVGRLLAPFAGAGGGLALVTIVAAVPAGVAAGTYPNVATASAPSAPPTTSPPAPVTVEGLANVSIIKSFPQGSDPDITPGTTETYRIRVVNDGPSLAAGVVVTDTLPVGLTATAWRVISVTPPGPTAACDLVSVTCTLGDLPPGTTIELELDVLVDAGLVIDPDVGVTNTANVSSSTPDPNGGDNTSNFTASGGAQADLSIRKLPPSPEREVFPVPAPVAGENTSYILEIINFGPSEAPGLVVTDVLPPGTTFVGVFDPTGDPLPPDLCTVGGDPVTVTCDFGQFFDFPPFVGTNIGIEVAVDSTVPDGTVLSNTATIDSDADDGNPGNNISIAVVPVRAEVNLTIRKRMAEFDASGNPVREVPYPDPLQLPAGYAVGFILEVFNEGPSAAAGVQVIDAFEPDAANFQTVQCDFLNGEVVCPYDNDATGDLLLPGQFFLPQILFLPEGDTPQGVSLNRARVSTTTNETILADNADQRTVEIVDPIADLIIEKAAVTSPLVAGETFTYQIAVSAGRIDLTPPGVLRLSSAAENVVITDSLPTGLVPTSASSSQGACTVIDQDISCALGTIGSTVDPARPQQPALVTVTGTVAPGILGTSVMNTAVARSTTEMLGGVTEVSDTEITPITRSADLAVTKVAESPTAAAGGGITFSVTVTNTGPSDATGVVLTDLLPAPLIFTANGSDAICSLATNVVCNLGTLTAGDTRTITIAATLPPGALPGTVINTASVTSDVGDPDGSDNSASVPIEVTQQADLSVTKTPTGEGVLLGETIAYTLVVVNDGPSDAAAVVLTESIPAGTNVVTLPPGCTGTGPVTCALGTVLAGDTRTLEIVIEVPESTPLGALANTASVTSSTADPDPTDNEATAIVEAIALADVVLEKTLVTSPAIAGQPLVYALTLTNLGPTIAPNPSLSDPLPPGTSFISFTAPGGTCQLDEVEDVPAASCSLAPLAVGASVTATLTLGTDPALRSVANTGFGGSGGLDENPEDNEDTVETSLLATADLAVSKSGPSSVSSAAPAEYVITYRNDGPAYADSVVVTDTFPTGLTPRPTTGCTITGQVVSCAVGTVLAGGSGSVTILADVAADLPTGTTLTDSAAISTSDPFITDPDPTDNTAELTSTVQTPITEPPANDIGVTVTANQDELPAGAQASYTVVVTNNGPLLASTVVLTNELPAELIGTSVLGGGGSGRRLPVQVPAGCLPTGRTVICALGDLTVGATRTFVLGGTIPAGTPVGTRLVHTATVSLNGIDIISANNSDADTILVIARVTVTTPPSGGGGSLPVVGAAIAGLLAVAAALVVSGGGLRVLAGGPRSGRQRRR